MSFRGIDHRSTARHVVGHHLLTEDICAGLKKSNSNIGVGPQRRCYKDNLQLLFFRHLLPVFVLARFLTTRYSQLIACLRPVSRVDIADRFNINKLFEAVAEQ